jgi:hypothetical protein
MMNRGSAGTRMVLSLVFLKAKKSVVSILLLSLILEGLESLANLRLALTPIYNLPQGCEHQYPHDALPVGHISAEQR